MKGGTTTDVSRSDGSAATQARGSDFIEEDAAKINLEPTVTQNQNHVGSESYSLLTFVVAVAVYAMTPPLQAPRESTQLKLACVVNRV